MDFKVFNVEFDGIDKCGKDSIMHQMFSVVPNMYLSKSRGLLSMIAYSHLYNRNYNYNVTQGYLDNTLFIWLTVDEEDWNIRCDLTHEHEKNLNRCDMSAKVTYKENSDAFDFAFNELKKLGVNECRLMKFNTSHKTPYEIICEVVNRLKELNYFNEE